MKSQRRGRPPHDDVLTPGEWRVVQAVRHGLRNRMIARLRGISLDAVKYHIENALAKLQLDSRSALRHWRGIPKHSSLYRRELNMSDSQPIVQLGAIGQISRTVSNIERAVEWYGKTLGLPHLFTFGKLAFFDCQGVRLYMQEHAPHTAESILYFRVPNIEAAYLTLKTRGVEFTGAPHLIHKHENGMEEWMAFFNDPDGRPLALMSQVAP
jgi:DNA-binding CsgD family transcriptional regulator/catechol 2,3-dioxygenase-like lactoylglutathione lyase family enzyme